MIAKADDVYVSIVIYISDLSAIVAIVGKDLHLPCERIALIDEDQYRMRSFLGDVGHLGGKYV